MINELEKENRSFSILNISEFREKVVVVVGSACTGKVRESVTLIGPIILKGLIKNRPTSCLINL